MSSQAFTDAAQEAVAATCAVETTSNMLGDIKSIAPGLWSNRHHVLHSMGAARRPQVPTFTPRF